MPGVLIVDDSEVDRRLAGGLLTKSGRYDVQYAENGSEALAALRRWQPDVVLTDLHMPDRGGMVVIEACRLHYHDLPVVLMTAMGSENMAVEALRAGAAGYVPKASLAEKLLDTIDEVVSHTEQDEAGRRLVSRLVHSEFRFEVDNSPDLVPPLVEMAEQMLSGLGICRRVDCMRVGSALKGAVIAAMLQGNLELPPETAAEEPTSPKEQQTIERRRSQSPYRDRRVLVELRFERELARFRIRHQGAPLWSRDQFNAIGDEGLDDPALRPIVLMQAFCDTVQIGPENDITLVVERKQG